MPDDGAQPLSFFAELKRRNVFRVGIAYAIAAWVILQIVDVVLPILELPEWASKFILVILAVGLIPALIFAWAFELTPEGLKKEKDVDRSQSITNKTGRKLDFIIIGILLVGIAFLLVDRGNLQDQAAPELAAESEINKSIAVLPFVNMSSDAEQDFFSDGITEEILNSLASVKELKVAGRTSSFAFKGQNDDLRKIGDTLGVEHILEGSVRKAGTKVRITAQLIQVEDGFHMWSETYDRELDDIFAIQDEIATEILRQLRAQLLEEDLDVIEAQRTGTQVYEWYLLAKQRMYERQRLSIESAAAVLDQAIALDPEYAPALAQRGIAALLLSDRSYGVTPFLESQEEAERFLSRSLELDPNLAEGWAGMGLYYANTPGKHEDAIEVLTRALDLNPNLMDASNWLYVTLGLIGDEKAALQIVEAMVEKDPLYRPAFGNSINSYNFFGQREKAWELIEKFESFYPNDPQVYRAKSLTYTWDGRAAEAYPLALKALELQPTDLVFRVSYSFALAQTSQIEKLAEEGAIFFRPFALYELGRKDEAFEIAYQLSNEGSPEPLFSLWNLESRGKDVVDYVDERWSSVDEFANENPQSGFGYDLMEEVAIAFRDTSDAARFDQAMEHIRIAIEKIQQQGINNIAVQMANARYLALMEEEDAAIEAVAQAVASGVQYYGVLTDDPAFKSIANDPRLQEIQQTVTANINEDRVALGLDPLPLGNELL